MNEQELLHKISVETDINIEFLKDVILDEQFLSLIRAKKANNAIMHLRTHYPNVDLGKAKATVDAFSARIQEISR